MAITISNTLLQELAKHIDERCVKADYTVNGKTYETPLRRSLVDNTTVRKHIYLTQKHVYGTVTRVRLLGANGEVIATRTDPHVHKATEGLLLEFKFVIKEG